MVGNRTTSSGKELDHTTLHLLRDENPDCKPDEKYKALGSGDRALYAFKSPDGIHWSLMNDEPVITKGAFDSQNLAFWDTVRGEYREYHRDFREGRDIRTGNIERFPQLD